MLFGLILGILFSNHLDYIVFWPSVWSIALFTLISLILLFFTGARLSGWLVFLWMVVLGFGLHQQNCLRPVQNGFYQHTQPGDTLLIVFLDIPQEKTASMAVAGDVMGVVTAGKRLTSRGKVQLYLQKTDEACALLPGDVIQVALRYDSITNDPYTTFDKESYFSRMGVYHTAYVRSDDWLPAAENALPAPGYFVRLRDRAEEVIRSWDMRPHSEQVMQALVLGDKRELDPEL
jgi:hypothetical protein